MGGGIPKLKVCGGWGGWGWGGGWGGGVGGGGELPLGSKVGGGRGGGVGGTFLITPPTFQADVPQSALLRYQDGIDWALLRNTIGGKCGGLTHAQSHALKLLHANVSGQRNGDGVLAWLAKYMRGLLRGHRESVASLAYIRSHSKLP